MSMHCRTHGFIHYTQVQEVAALLAARAASEAWAAGDPARALGAVELAALLDFKGPPPARSRGRGAADGGTAAAAVLDALLAETAEVGGDAPVAGGGGAQQHTMWLQRRLEALFPAAPRLAFQAV